MRSKSPIPPKGEAGNLPDGSQIAVLPHQLSRIEHGAIDACPFEIPTSIRLGHSSHTAEADAQPACHGCLKRDVAADSSITTIGSDCLHHRLRPAANHTQLLPSRIATFGHDLRQKFRYQAMMSCRTVIRRQTDIDAGRQKVVNSGMVRR